MTRAPAVDQIFGQASRMFAAGDPLGAARLCHDALRSAPKHVSGLHLYAACRMAIGDIAGAEETLSRAVKLAPRSADLQVGHGATLLRLNRLDEAAGACERALALSPGDPNACACKAEVLFRLRRFNDAAEVLSPFVASGSPHLGVALSFATLCPRIGRQDEAIAMLRRCLGDPTLAPPDRMRALFALGELLDAQDRYEDAFDACAQAHALKAPRRDVAPYRESLEAMLAAWTREAVEALPKASLETELPVYIVGMPRSGTSLVEQILASHPLVHGGGERQDIGRLIADIQAGRPGAPYHLRHLDALTRKVVDRSARKVADALRALDVRAERITDKNPDNYLHLGLIATLFPRARIVHCVRDPLDTGLSCFLNNIGRRGPAGHSVHAFADSLDDIGRWLRSYGRVMEHWKSVLPIQILDLRYEDLVTDPESTVRRLLQHVGLPWDDACLRFHESSRIVLTPSLDQVRRPMYATAVGRWKKYERRLGPLRAALESA